MKENKRGITLIALIISIIVMLILVGVTVTVSLNGGLFEKAREGAKGTTIARVKEQIIGDITAKIADKLGENITEDELISIIENGGYGEVNVADNTVTIEGESIKLEDIWECKTGTDSSSDFDYKENFVYSLIPVDKFSEEQKTKWTVTGTSKVYVLIWDEIKDHITGDTEQEKLYSLESLNQINEYFDINSELTDDHNGYVISNNKLIMVTCYEGNETVNEMVWGEFIEKDGRPYYKTDDLEIPLFFRNDDMYIVFVG